ncbi:MAG: MBL fold metallo-hydrolase [Pseudomonadota bacterium]
MTDDDAADGSKASPVDGSLRYPFADQTPDSGALIPVADGVYWLRMPLPFSLDHINLWLLDDGDDAVTIVDTGLNTSVCRKVWDTVFETHIGGRQVSRIIVTHFHPDHLGLAGWLCERTGAPLYMTQAEYLMGRLLTVETHEKTPDEVVAFYKAAGHSDEWLDILKGRGYGGFKKVVSRVPTQYHKIRHGSVLQIGARRWRVHIGRGHAPEHACLVDNNGSLLISGDQVLPRITSNVSVFPGEPEADPLDDWMKSLDELKSIDRSVLVLPSHNEPFFGLHDRLDGLKASHHDKLDRLLQSLGEPRTAVDCFDVLFRRKITVDDMMMATGEALAHLHYLVRRGTIERFERDNVVHSQNRDAVAHKPAA